LNRQTNNIKKFINKNYTTKKRTNKKKRKKIIKKEKNEKYTKN